MRDWTTSVRQVGPIHGGLPAFVEVRITLWASRVCAPRSLLLRTIRNVSQAANCVQRQSLAEAAGATTAAAVATTVVAAASAAATTAATKETAPAAPSSASGCAVPTLPLHYIVHPDTQNKEVLRVAPPSEVQLISLISFVRDPISKGLAHTQTRTSTLHALTHSHAHAIPHARGRPVPLTAKPCLA